MTIERNKIRNKVQEETIDAWFSNQCVGYAIISMGVGKSKIIADSVNRIMDTPKRAEIENSEIPILILVNSTFLRDDELPVELEKWQCNYPVKIACYQTAYKWKEKSIGLLICDELDFTISESERYLRSITNNYFKYWFGMTGSLIEKKSKILTQVFPRRPFYVYSLEQAQNDGVVNKIKVILHEVPLSNEVYEHTPYGEIAKYKWIQRKIDSLKSEISAAYKVLSMQAHYPYDMVYNAEQTLNRAMKQKQYWESSNGNKNSRKMTLYSLKSTKDYAIALKNYLLSKPENKVILFTEFTKDVDYISINTYHGKSPNNKVIKEFNLGNIRELGVCKKVNRGVNFVGLNHAIVQSFSGSVTNALQGYIGRLVRLDPNEIAFIHFLYSSYPDGDTLNYCQNLQWIQNILSTSELDHIEEIYYKLQTI